MKHALVASLLLGTASAQSTTTVTTSLGSVRGLAFSTHNAFLGVPFGAPPVGALRWASPVPRAAWSPATWDATNDPVGCPQVCVTDEPPHICPQVQGEDCLFMNIYTPAVAPAGPMPVIMFFHGGNFHDGYAGGYNLTGGLLYDGHEFVNTTQSIIVVPQYRLGALGFLYMGGASKKTTIEGNFGLQDQVLAMEWVRDNIAAFGGDGNRVTLMGQSAGAMSISAHLSRPQTAGLYVGTIEHSNPYSEPYRTPPEALSVAAGFANFSGCGPNWWLESDWSQLEACLRQKDADTIVAAAAAAELDLLADLDAILQVVVAWGPTVGTDYLRQRPLEAFQAGNVIDVPRIVGTTENETVIFVYEVLDTPMPELLYELLVGLLVSPAALPEINKLYPLPKPTPPDLRVFSSTVLTDGLFLCPTRNATEALYVKQPARKSPTYHYVYSHLLSWGQAAWGANFTECDNNVCHGSDLPEWWLPRTAPSPAFGNYSNDELNLGHTWQAAWANFAATGSPGSPGGVAWPAYDAKTRSTFNWRTAGDGGLVVENGNRRTFCEWWDLNGYRVY